MYLTKNWTIFFLSNLEVQLSKYVVSFIWGELRFWMVPYHLTFFGVFLRFEHFFSLVSCGAVSYTKISNQWHRRGLWCICAPTFGPKHQRKNWQFLPYPFYGRICQIFSSVFWSKRWNQKDILKLTELYWIWRCCVFSCLASVSINLLRQSWL